MDLVSALVVQRLAQGFGLRWKVMGFQVNLRGMKCVVTGGAGFVGARMAKVEHKRREGMRVHNGKGKEYSDIQGSRLNTYRRT